MVEKYLFTGERFNEMHKESGSTKAKMKKKDG
jgi:hypothetical protein